MICKECICHQDAIRESATGLPVGVHKKCCCLISHEVVDDATRGITNCSAFAKTEGEWDAEQRGRVACQDPRLRAWTFKEMLEEWRRR